MCVCVCHVLCSNKMLNDLPFELGGICMRQRIVPNQFVSFWILRVVCTFKDDIINYSDAVHFSHCLAIVRAKAASNCLHRLLFQALCIARLHMLFMESTCGIFAEMLSSMWRCNVAIAFFPIEKELGKCKVLIHFLLVSSQRVPFHVSRFAFLCAIKSR